MIRSLPCRLCTEIRRDSTSSNSPLSIKKDCLESVGTWLLRGFRSVCGGRTIFVTQRNQLKEIPEATSSKITPIILLILFAPIALVAGIIGFTALLLSCSHRKQFKRIAEALKLQFEPKPAPVPKKRALLPDSIPAKRGPSPLAPPTPIVPPPSPVPPVPTPALVPDAVLMDPRRWVPNVSPRYLEKIKPVLTIEENEKDPIRFNLSATAVKREGKSGYAVTMNATSQLPVDIVNSRGDFSFVLDVSGSMFKQFVNGKPIEHAQKALLKFLKTLLPTDRFCVFKYDISASLIGEGLVPATPENIERMMKNIKQIKNQKLMTNFRSMLDESMSMLVSVALANKDKEESQARAINTIILTDGRVDQEDYRVDDQDFQSLHKKIRLQFPYASYRTHTIAIPGGDAVLMKQMANAGSGYFYDLTTEFNSQRVGKVLNAIRQSALPVVVRKFELHLNLTGVQVTVQCIADEAIPPNWKAEVSQNRDAQSEQQTTTLATRKVELLVENDVETPG